MKGLISGIQALWSGIQTIINGILMGIQFLINLVKSLIELVRILITTASNTTSLILTLPPWLIAFATASLSIAILYLILGRESGK